jgi:hypothetical protein
MPGLGGSHVAFWDECAPGRFGDTGEWKLCKVALSRRVAVRERAYL